MVLKIEEKLSEFTRMLVQFMKFQILRDIFRHRVYELKEK